MNLLFFIVIILLARCSFAFVNPSFATTTPRVTTALRSSLTSPPSNDDATAHHAVKHTRWGIDKDRTEEYWFNNKIHTLGNIGIMGALHAAVAPLATKMIDDVAYHGVDVRASIAEELAKSINHNKARVVDLCCGVGISTRALQGAFPDADAVIGVDTSPQMISMANFLNDQQSRMQPISDFFNKYFSGMNKSLSSKGIAVKRAYVKARRAIAEYTCANAENTALPDKSFDLVTVMYAFHEAPRAGRENILAEARRLLNKGGMLALLDITPDYEPSESMLAGEPYVLEYQKNINRQLRMVKGFSKATFRTIVPGHVGLWILRRV